MKFIISGVFLVVAAYLIDDVQSNSGGKRNLTVEYYFELFEIVPDIIKRAPINNMTVVYPDGSSVELGNNLTDSQVSEKPNEVSFRSNDDDYYTLLFFQTSDFGNKKCAPGSQVLQWFVYNIRGDDISTGEELFPYLAPSVQNFRYVYLVLEQKKFIRDPIRGNDEASISRECFSTKNFIKYFARSNPVAGAFFILVNA